MDRGAWAGLLGNILTFAAALWLDWPLAMLLWPLWLQTAAYGLFNAWRMWTGPVPLFEARPGDSEVSPGALRLILTGFFLAHYGIFHVVFGVLLLELSFGGGVEEAGLGEAFAATPGWRDAGLVLALGVAYVLSLRAELPAWRAADARGPMRVALRVMGPYVRVLPTLGLVLVGALLVQVAGLDPGHWMLPAFFVLKALADLLAHRLDRA